MKTCQLITALLFVGFLQVSANGLAQKITLKEKDAPLEKVFKEISKQIYKETGYGFLYNMQQLQSAPKVNVTVTNATLEEALRATLQHTNFSYTIKDKTIVISPRIRQGSLTGGLPPTLLAPVAITLQGRVVNENGEPVVVTVLVKGTQNGTSSNNDGYFELKAVDENATLVISGVSIEPIEVKVKGRTNIGTLTVRMKITALNEVVVNKGYYMEKQKLSTGSVGRVSSKEIERQPVLNPLQAMQGRIAGVDIVQQTGLPGGGFSVVIRGENSIANGTSPLYVVDGVPFNSQVNGGTTSGAIYSGISTLNFINPQDIESIEVLKDADATAIYGSRGANGVVLITTKKAKAGQTTVNLNMSQGIGHATRRIDLMNKEQWVQFRLQSFRTAGLTPGANDYDVNGTWANNPETDWQKKLIGGTARYSDIQLGVSGGNALTQFNINTSFHRETTVYPKEFPYSRGSVQFSVNNSSANKKFTLNFSGMYSFTEAEMPYSNLMSYVTHYPNAPQVYDANGNLNYPQDWLNPYSHFEAYNKTKSNTLVGSMIAGYQFNRNFSARLTANYNQLHYTDNQAFPSTYYRPSQNISPSSYFGTNNNHTWNIEPQLNYETRIGNGSFAALAGATFQENTGNSNTIQGTGYNDNSLIGGLAGAAALVKGGVSQTQYRYQGLYLRFNYNWQDKYIVNLTARRDGSSRFAPSVRFRNFGAVGAAWLFSNEEFIKRTLPFISYGKLRSSYGVSGNDQFDDYRYLDLYSYTNFAVLYQNTQGLFPGNLYNPDLVWEENRKFELALEMGILKDRINLTAAWFRNRSGNQLVQTPLPATTGFTTIWSNLPALVQNTGWEFTLNIQNINGKHFKWKTTFNISDQQNKLLSFPGLEKSVLYNQRMEVGKSVNNRKYFKYAGVDPLMGVYTFRTRGGGITYAPTALIDEIVDLDLDPRFFGGFGNTFTYNGFELDVFFQFSKKLGNNPLLIIGQQHPGYFLNFAPQNKPVFFLNAWQKPGDITEIQRLSPVVGTEFNAYQSLRSSDYSLVDASYLRLKNLALSWQFTKGMKRKMHLQNGRVYIQAQNLLTFTNNYQGWDPEPTIDQLTLQPLRTITAGIQLTF